MTEAATREVERDMAKPCTSNKGGASKSRSTRPLESGGSLRMPLSLRRSQRGMDGQKESSRALSLSGFWEFRPSGHAARAHTSTSLYLASLLTSIGIDTGGEGFRLS